jgi:hypothetical protein
VADDLQARVARILAKARADEAVSLPRLRAENPEFAAWVDDYKATFGATVTYVQDRATGRQWGATAEDRVRAAGGLGVSVQAGWMPKGRERRARAGGL